MAKTVKIKAVNATPRSDTEQGGNQNAFGVVFVRKGDDLIAAVSPDVAKILVGGGQATEVK